MAAPSSTRKQRAKSSCQTAATAGASRLSKVSHNRGEKRGAAAAPASETAPSLLSVFRASGEVKLIRLQRRSSWRSLQATGPQYKPLHGLDNRISQFPGMSLPPSRTASTERHPTPGPPALKATAKTIRDRNILLPENGTPAAGPALYSAMACLADWKLKTSPRSC
jgi:hypothetical protein